VLDIDLDSIRLFLHVLGAAVWVGGQLVLAGVVPTLRRTGTQEATLAVARQFNRIAWPAFGLLVVTGIWNIFEQPDDLSNEYNVTFGIKMVFVIASGVAAWLHATQESRKAKAIGGAVGFLGGLVAMFLGVVLTVQGPFG
jgi:putative copper export protein